MVKKVKHRNFIAKELWENPLFKPKVLPDKKNIYKRKRFTKDVTRQEQ